MQEGRGCAMEVDVDNKIQSTIKVEEKGVVHKMKVIIKLELTPTMNHQLIDCNRDKMCPRDNQRKTWLCCWN